jgi:hypothetical protein
MSRGGMSIAFDDCVVEVTLLVRHDKDVITLAER